MKNLQYPLSERLVPEVKTALDEMSNVFPEVHKTIMKDLNDCEFITELRYRTILYLQQFVLGNTNNQVWDIVTEIKL